MTDATAAAVAAKPPLTQSSCSYLSYASAVTISSLSTNFSAFPPTRHPRRTEESVNKGQSRSSASTGRCFRTVIHITNATNVWLPRRTYPPLHHISDRAVGGRLSLGHGWVCAVLGRSTARSIDSRRSSSRRLSTTITLIVGLGIVGGWRHQRCNRSREVASSSRSAIPGREIG